MLTQDFDYVLPKEKIADHPASPRDHARLMVLDRKKKTISDHFFYELKDLLKEGDLLVANDSKVLPARLYGQSSSGKRVEVLLLNAVNANTWKALVRGGKEEELDFGCFRGVAKRSEENFEVAFDLAGRELLEAVHTVGLVPLPPYIKREKADEHDERDYQTVYAHEEGSAAAPTAGLHFTKRLMRELEEKGIDVEFVTLHVGLGTFKPVKTDVVEEHKMHAEYFEISESTAAAINKAKREGRRIIAIGTTTVRVLESVASLSRSDLDRLDQVRAISGWTEIFIYPGYEFKVTDGLITNFHLPKSSLMMLVAAFAGPGRPEAGKKFTMEAYQKAVEGPYKFYSYGDAMLIL